MGKLTVVVLGLPVLLAACSVLFDTPPESAAKPKVSARVEHDLSAIVEEETRAINAEKVLDATAHMAETEQRMDSQILTSGDGKRTLALSFEKVDADMPRLVMRGLGNAIVEIDGERIEPGKVRQENIVLISPGQHELLVEYAGSQPFSAKFYIKKGERAILRANPAPAK